MNDLLREPAAGPTLWQGDQFARDLSWIHELSRADISELEDGLATARSSGVEPIGFTRESFPLPTFGAKIERILDEVQNGRGFAIFRGLPVERYKRADLDMIYWGIGPIWAK